jgi:hypothetical protein
MEVILMRLRDLKVGDAVAFGVNAHLNGQYRKAIVAKVEDDNIWIGGSARPFVNGVQWVGNIKLTVMCMTPELSAAVEHLELVESIKERIYKIEYMTNEQLKVVKAAIDSYDDELKR